MLSRALLAVVVTAALAGTAQAQSNEGGIVTDIQNEKAVRALYAAFTKAWNAHDVEAIGGMWAIDGDHVEPDGRRAQGRAAVTLLMQRQHDTVFKDTHLDLSIADVWFIGGNVALVDGGYELTGARLPDGRALPARRGRLTAILIEEQGRWWIAASRLMIPTELPYKKADG